MLGILFYFFLFQLNRFFFNLCIEHFWLFTFNVRYVWCFVFRQTIKCVTISAHALSLAHKNACANGVKCAWAHRRTRLVLMGDRVSCVVVEKFRHEHFRQSRVISFSFLLFHLARFFFFVTDKNFPIRLLNR